jgi:hypothetical protein
MTNRESRRDTYGVNVLVQNYDAAAADDRETYYRFGMLETGPRVVNSYPRLARFIQAIQEHHLLISAPLVRNTGETEGDSKRRRLLASNNTRGEVILWANRLVVEEDQTTPIRRFDMLDPYMLGDTTTTTTTTSNAPRRAGTSETITQSATPSSVYRLEVIGFWREPGRGFVTIDEGFIPPVQVMFSNESGHYISYAPFVRDRRSGMLILPEEFYILGPTNDTAENIRGEIPDRGTFPTMDEIMQASAHLPEVRQGRPARLLPRPPMPPTVDQVDEGEAAEGQAPGGGMMDNMQQCLRCGNWRKSKC